MLVLAVNGCHPVGTPLKKQSTPKGELGRPNAKRLLTGWGRTASSKKFDGQQGPAADWGKAAARRKR